MEVGREFAMYLFAAIAIGYGVYGFIKGEITYGPEGGNPEHDRTLMGTKAKFVAALLALSGVVLLFNATIGLCMVVGVVFLPWIIGD